MRTDIPLLSTAYLPTIRYIACLVLYGAATIERNETFPKQTFRNRTQIATGNGILMLQVPVSRPSGNHTMTGEITVSYHEPWNVRHWRAIVSAYNAAPYFLYYRDDIEEILLKPHDKLVELNDQLLKFLLKKMKIECELDYSTDYIPAGEHPLDYRGWLTSKKGQRDESFPSYSQVFDAKNGFMPNMSVIDLLFNMGPEAKSYLQNLCTAEQRI